MSKDRYQDFISSYTGKELLKKHSLSETGIWKVREADNNCDFGGNHYQAEIGRFEGTLQDIITHAVTLPGFWAWSSGDITKVKPPVKIDSQSNQKRIELQARKDELIALMGIIEKQLKDME